MIFLAPALLLLLLLLNFGVSGFISLDTADNGAELVVLLVPFVVTRLNDDDEALPPPLEAERKLPPNPLLDDEESIDAANTGSNRSTGY